MSTNLDLTYDELFDYLIQEAEANFAGWDFSYISRRYVSAVLSWSYDMKVWPKIRRARYAFRDYVEKYPKAKAPRRRMPLIDRLINAFHWSIRRQRHHGPAANQLIQGKSDEVLAFLDKLSAD